MSTPVLVSDITRISHRFAVKWSIPLEKLRYEPTSGEGSRRIIKSNIYRFKDIKNLEFSFHLICSDGDYEMVVNCKTGLPILQEDALILIEDSIYRVKCNSTNTNRRKIFNPLILVQESFPDDKVTVHCIMSIPAEIKAVISNPEENREVDIVDCESIVTDLGIHPYKYDDAVSEFLFSSRIPDFNILMAVTMILEAHVRKIPILKALCFEYLIESLTTENVLDVLKLSINYDAKNHARRCVEFIAQNRQIILPNTSSSNRSQD